MNDTETPLAKVSLRDILFIIFSKQKVLVGIFAVIVLITFLVAFFADAVYEVDAKVLVKPTMENVLPNQLFLSNPALQMSRVPLEVLNSEINIVLSDELLRKVVEDPELGLLSGGDKNVISRAMDEVRTFIRNLVSKQKISTEESRITSAISDLKATLRVEPITLSNMIEISMKGKDPEHITNVVNSVTDRFIDRHIEVYESQGDPEFFAAQTAQYAKQLKESETALQNFVKDWSIIDIETQRLGNLRLLETLRENLSTVQGQIAETQTRLGLSKDDLSAMTKEIRENPFLYKLSETMLPLMVEKERVATLYPKSSVEFQDIDSQLKEMNKQARTEISRFHAGSEIDLQAMVSQEKIISDTIAKIEADSRLLTEKETEYKNLVRELEQNEKLYLLYKDKTEEVRIQKQQEMNRVANVAVASWAYQPVIPVFPKRIPMMLISIVVGLLMGVAGAFIAYYMDHTVKMPSDLPRHAEIPILSAVGIVETTRKG